MRERLHQLLRCPECGHALGVTAFTTAPDTGEVADGILTCACGMEYPIVDTIPRMLNNAYTLFPAFAERYRGRVNSQGRLPGGRMEGLPGRTQRSFGYQWTTFSKMVCDFKENFWNYLAPATPDFFHGRLGLDAGCGFGRHIYHAASCGAEMVGVDFSQAIDATRQNTKQLPNVHLVQADIYHLPFAEGSFDFVYSIGVLHHLPDPIRGGRVLAALLQDDGTLFVWLYSSTRRLTNALLGGVRAVTTRMPHWLVWATAWSGAVIDWLGFVLPYRLLSRIPGACRVAERLTPARIKVYNQYPFQVLHADWFDRLAAPIRFYYDEAGVRALITSAGLSDVQVMPTGLYGWRGCGIRRRASAAAPQRDLQQLGTA